jgi:EpsI family protein
MQKAPVLAVISAALVLSALVANHAIGRVQTSKPRVLAIEAFPRQVGDWKAVEDRPVDKRIQAFLPTARIVQRTYKDSTNRTVDCTLITASNTRDIHNPNICLPGQGWELGEQRTIKQGKQAINTMVARQEELQYNMWYWWVGDSIGTAQGSESMTKLFALRNLIMKERISTLSVRLFGPHDSKGDAAIADFAAAIQEPLAVIAAR